MKILYIAPTDPREISYGGQQRTHVMWKGLCSIPGAKVSVFVPTPHRHSAHEDDQSKIYRLCFEKRYTLGWFAQRILKRWIPFWDCSWAYDWKALHRRFSGTDVVVSRYVQPVAAYRLEKLAPLYVDVDDIHTVEFDLQSAVVGQSFWRSLKRKFVDSCQFNAFKKARRLWVPVREHVALFPNYPFGWLPNIPCPPLPTVLSSKHDKNRLMFVGLLASDANYLALDAFFSCYWKRLRLDFPEIKIDVIGKGLPESYVEDWRQYEGVLICGPVKDIRPFYAQCLAVITPMIIGMGSCIKVLEALSMGRPVVSTDCGLRGIEKNDRKEDNGIFEYKDYDSLRDVISQLQIKSAEKFYDIGVKGIEFVGKKFSQNTINGILKKELISWK